MCGIVGYIGPREATTIVFDGLKRLEYRGYDSSGMATIQNGGITIRRDEGKLSNLERLMAEQPINGHIAIGHTRWAAHGVPSQRNAHPHTDCTGEIAVIQNGIVENFLGLRQSLRSEGHKFSSETDTEVIVHLVERYMNVHFQHHRSSDFEVQAGRRTLQHMSQAKPKLDEEFKGGLNDSA